MTTQSIDTSPAPDIAIPRLLGLGMGTRFLIDTGQQYFNSFLPIVAAGLGLSTVVLGRLVGLRSLLGIVAPLFGVLADRYGYRLMMRIALVLVAAGTLLFAANTSLAWATVAMILWGMGGAGFIPTLHAYLSARLPYARRARGIGIVEYAWALASIVGLSAAGLLIAATGSWRAPLFVLGIALLGAVVALGQLPTARAGSSTAPTPKHPPLRLTRSSVTQFWRLGDNARSSWSLIVGIGFLFFSAVQIMIAHGAWLSDAYGLGAAQLGTVALIFGVVDLGGSGGVSLVTDRLGKRRSVLLGAAVAMAGYALLPVLNVGLVAAVAGLAVARLGFEFAIVAGIPLLSEQIPAQRAKVLTLSTANVSIAGALAGVSGPWLYERLGVLPLAVVSLVAAGLAVGLIWGWVRE